MWLVALEDDASYPGALARTDDTCSAARPAPLAAGEALAWNANVLHWGGPCSAAAKGPRTSCSFSLVRADAVDRLPFPPVSLEGLDLERRLDVVAAQIEVYGEGQPDVTREARAWAAARRALAAASDASSSLRDSFPSR